MKSIKYFHKVFLTAIALTLAAFTFAQPTNLAAGKASQQSTTNSDKTADKAVDADSNSISETTWSTSPWWQVDLGNRYSVSKIDLVPAWENHLDDFIIIFSDIEFPNAPLDDETSILEKSAVKAIRVTEGNKWSYTVPVSPAVTARYIRIQRKAGTVPLGLKDVKIMGDPTPVTSTPPVKESWPVNLAAGKTAVQSTTEGDHTANKAVDTDNNSYSKTNWTTAPWWQVDLGNRYSISEIKLAIGWENELKDFFVIFSDDLFPAVELDFEISVLEQYAVKAIQVNQGITANFKVPVSPAVTARYVRIQRRTAAGDKPLELKNISIIGAPVVVTGPPPTKQPWSVLLNSSTVVAHVDNVRSQVIGIRRPSDGKLCVAWVDAVNNKANIKVNIYDPSSNYTKVGSSVSVPNGGELGGFAVDDANNTYVLSIQRAQQNTGKPLVINGTTMNNYCGDMKLYKGTTLLWDADEDRNSAPPDGCPGAINDPGGRARISVGNNKVFVAYQGAANWPWHVVLNDNGTQSIEAKTTLLHHMDQGHIRSMFDGSDFVVVEDRDHDMGITMMKYGAASPITGVEYNNVRPVYTHSTFGNGTFTEIGGIAKGLNNGNDGYLVLFASDRDWDYIFDDWSMLPASSSSSPTNDPKFLKAEPGDIKTWPGSPFTPRDLAVVHVKKNFSDASLVNHGYMKNGQREASWACEFVDNSKVINSSGSYKAVTFKSVNDGWDWNTYNCCGERDKIFDGLTERNITKDGVNWLTSNGSAYESGNNNQPPSLPSSHTNFTNATRPKLVMISTNTYIAIWEEWTNGGRGNMGTYSTTKAMKITLSGSANDVNVTTGTTQTFPGKRLYQFDDAFELGGKAAWITGDKTKLILHTIDSGLNYSSYDLSL